MNKLPKIISPCPIIEAITEIRFSSTLPSDAIFGILYAKVLNDFKKPERQPVMQIPEQIRNQDPNLMYQTHYSLISKDELLRFNIGPRAFVISNVNKYIGWEKYFYFIKNLFDKINDSQVVEFPERIGFRYINFFKDILVLDKINLIIELCQDDILNNHVELVTTKDDEKFKRVLKIGNNITMKLANKYYNGSFIDIDYIYSFKELKKTPIKRMLEIIEEAHEKEKITFFTLLKEEFLRTLNPEY